MQISKPLRAWISGAAGLGLSHTRERGTDMTYLTKLTVPALREIADRMGIKFPSRAKKAEIVERLSIEIGGDHIKALIMDTERAEFMRDWDMAIAEDGERYVAAATVGVEASEAPFLGMTATARMSAYRAQNTIHGAKGRLPGGSFTAAQSRRILKKFRYNLKKHTLAEIY